MKFAILLKLEYLLENFERWNKQMKYYAIKIVGKNLYINRMGAYTIYKNQAYVTPDILKINKYISILNLAHISERISFEIVEIDSNLI